MRDHTCLAPRLSADPIYKQVVIVGNGPSAISMSFFLSGNIPHYNGISHPDPMLTARLQSASSSSLIEQDLKFLAQGLEGRSNNPVSLLIDSLMHPYADQGMNLPSVLKYEYSSDSAIDHVVIGKGAPGGVWQDMKKNILTISLSSWMDLPGFSFQEWLSRGTDIKEPIKRVKAGKVAQYFSDYVKHTKLSKFFKNYSTVTVIHRLECSELFTSCGQMIEAENGLWLVSGFNNITHEPFSYITPRVILATGTSDIPNKLNVPGENLSGWVTHDLASFECLLNKRNKLIGLDAEDKTSEPVLVVGAGLSAADAILFASRHSVPVIHIFNSNSTSVIKSLPNSIYPEYHRVYSLLSSNEIVDDNYCKLPDCQVMEFTNLGSDHFVKIKSSDERIFMRKVSSAVILIGSRPNLTFLPEFFQEGRSLGVVENEPVDCKRNPLNLDPWTHEVVSAPPRIYALGPLAGDNFVRFLSGGAVAILCHIHRELKRQAVR